MENFILKFKKITFLQFEFLCAWHIAMQYIRPKFQQYTCLHVKDTKKTKYMKIRGLFFVVFGPKFCLFCAARNTTYYWTKFHRSLDHMHAYSCKKIIFPNLLSIFLEQFKIKCSIAPMFWKSVLIGGCAYLFLDSNSNNSLLAYKLGSLTRYIVIMESS